MYAGAAVGVSHLVQSTRAGAGYGAFLILAVVLANVLKYPFFKAGPLYATINKRSLLEGFFQLGPWAMGLFYFITVSSMFIVQAAVALICASVCAVLFSWEYDLWILALLIQFTCFGMLYLGKYERLSQTMKWVIALLALSTLFSLLASLPQLDSKIFTNINFSFSNELDLFFLIALMGWMPAPLDIALWHSEWSLLDKSNQKEKDSRFDFNLGYWGTAILAIAFVLLGAILLFQSGEQLSSSGVQFSQQLIHLYTKSLGDWAFPVVAIAAFTTMFSTTLTVLDAYPRILSKAIALQRPEIKDKEQKVYQLLCLVLVLGSCAILFFAAASMKQLIDFVTIVSFLLAPLLALLIYVTLMKSEKVKPQLSKGFHLLSYAGLIFLFGFSIVYLFLRFY